MRRHGWGGDLPEDDATAEARILATARTLLRERPGVAPSVAQVADRLSVTRQTVYRYFPSGHALLVASVSEGVSQFLDAIAEHLRGCTIAADAVVEGIAFTYEQLHERTDLSLLIAASGSSPNEVTSDTAMSLGRSILARTAVDWPSAGYGDDALDGLVEHMLRTLQSLVIDPGNPPRDSAQIRAYLRRWIAPAVDQARC